MQEPKTSEKIQTKNEPLTYNSTASERHTEIIEHMNTCCLCGSELSFHHETNYLNLTVREEAHCHNCGIRNKKEAYTIQ